CSALDLTQIIGCQFNIHCSDIFVESLKLCCARDRDNPRLLSKQPSQSNLSRCCPLLFGELAKQINQGLIRFSSLWRKARDDVAEVVFIELRICIDLACQEALAERA